MTNTKKGRRNLSFNAYFILRHLNGIMKFLCDRNLIPRSASGQYGKHGGHQTRRRSADCVAPFRLPVQRGETCILAEGEAPTGFMPVASRRLSLRQFAEAVIGEMRRGAIDIFAYASPTSLRVAAFKRLLSPLP